MFQSCLGVQVWILTFFFFRRYEADPNTINTHPPFTTIRMAQNHFIEDFDVTFSVSWSIRQFIPQVFISYIKNHLTACPLPLGICVMGQWAANNHVTVREAQQKNGHHGVVVMRRHCRFCFDCFVVVGLGTWWFHDFCLHLKFCFIFWIASYFTLYTQINQIYRVILVCWWTKSCNSLWWMKTTISTDRFIRWNVQQHLKISCSNHSLHTLIYPWGHGWTTYT